MTTLPRSVSAVMNSQNCSISTCRNCRHFQTEGRRGGLCEQLGTFTDPTWSACQLAIAAFDPLTPEIESIETLEHSFTLKFEGEVTSEQTPILSLNQP